MASRLLLYWTIPAELNAPAGAQLLGREPGVDGERHARDIPAGVADQVEDGIRHVDRLDHVDRHQIADHRRHLGVLRDERADDVIDDHRCIHPGRMDAVDSDAVRRQPRGERAHQADDSVLRGGVPGYAGRAVAAPAREALGRAGQHDSPALPPLEHAGSGHRDGVPHADQVRVDDVAEGSVRVGLGTASRCDPGVGQNDVDRAELGDARCEGPLERSAVPDVGADGVDAPVECLDLAGRLGEVLRPGHRVVDRIDLAGDVDGDDVRAFLGEPDRMAAALAAGSAGDEGDLAVELSHACCSSRRDDTAQAPLKCSSTKPGLASSTARRYRSAMCSGSNGVPGSTGPLTVRVKTRMPSSASWVPSRFATPRSPSLPRDKVARLGCGWSARPPPVNSNVPPPEARMAGTATWAATTPPTTSTR